MIIKLIKHGALFVLAKSTVLIAPLFAAHLLDKSSYGLFEWSLASAMMVNSMISLGSSNTIAFEKVRNAQSPLIVVGQKYSIYLGLVLAVLGGVSPYYFDGVKMSTVLGISSFLVMQFALSAYIKASGFGARASVIDSGIYIILLGLLIFAWAQGETQLPYGVCFSVFALMLGMLLSRTINTSVVVTKVEVRKFLKRGIPIMLSGVMVVLFVNLPKLLLGSESMMLVGVFSLYFRWAALAIVVHQFIIVIFFRDIYNKSYRDFDKFIASISTGIYLLGLLILVFLYFANIYNVSYLPLPVSNMTVQILMVPIIALWSLSASVEGLLYREDKSIHQLCANLVGIIIFLIIYNYDSNKEGIIYTTMLSWFFAYIGIIFYQGYIVQKLILKESFFLKNYFLLLISFLTFLFVEIKYQPHSEWFVSAFPASSLNFLENTILKIWHMAQSL